MCVLKCRNEFFGGSFWIHSGKLGNGQCRLWMYKLLSSCFYQSNSWNSRILPKWSNRHSSEDQSCTPSRWHSNLWYQEFQLGWFLAVSAPRGIRIQWQTDQLHSSHSRHSITWPEFLIVWGVADCRLWTRNHTVMVYFKIELEMAKLKVIED